MNWSCHGISSNSSSMFLYLKLQCHTAQAKGRQNQKVDKSQSRFKSHISSFDSNMTRFLKTESAEGRDTERDGKKDRKRDKG